MEYLGWFVVALLTVLFLGLLVADHKLADLRLAMGVVVKKRSRSYPLSAPGGAWEMSFRYETFEFELDQRTEFDIWDGKFEIVPVSKPQYDETPIGARVYVKYLETRFLGNKIQLDFRVADENETIWRLYCRGEIDDI